MLQNSSTDSLNPQSDWKVGPGDKSMLQGLTLIPASETQVGEREVIPTLKSLGGTLALSFRRIMHHMGTITARMCIKTINVSLEVSQRMITAATEFYRGVMSTTLQELPRTVYNYKGIICLLVATSIIIHHRYKLGAITWRLISESLRNTTQNYIEENTKHTPQNARDVEIATRETNKEIAKNKITKTLEQTKTYIHLLAHLTHRHIHDLQGVDEMADTHEMHRYWLSDAYVQDRRDQNTPTVTMCINADYYHNIPMELGRDDSIFVFHTLNPIRAASDSHDHNGAYYFDKHNNFNHITNTKTVYTHPLWNYNTTHVAHNNLLKRTRTIYKLHMVQYNELRAMVVLAPIRTIHGWIPMMLDHLLIGTPELCRFKPNQDGFTRIDTNDQPQTSSIAITNTTTDIRILTRQLDGLRSIYNRNPQTFTIGTVQTNAKLPREAATIIADYIARFPDHEFVPISHGVRVYEICEENPIEPKTPLRAVATPLYSLAYAPTQTKNNEEACILGRMKKPYKESTATRKLNRMMYEFTDFLHGDCGRPQLQMYDIETVYERQHRPTQRAILNRAINEDDPEIVKLFLKREAYQKATDPRPIAILPGQWKLHYSRVIYALADTISENCEWYAFGKKPREIAELIAHYCSEATTANLTDFSRFDGSIRTMLRNLDDIIITTFFHTMHRQTARDLYAKQLNAKIRSKNGAETMSEGVQLSGSADTALFNSIRCKFIAYVGMRLEGHTPDEAYYAHGLYGGDDGITFDANPDTHVAAANAWGLTLEIETLHRGDPGVNFLSRYYGPDVWGGDPNSCCDIKRQTVKIHTSPQLPDNVTPAQILYTKLQGFYLSDKHTPIIGWLATYAIEKLHKPAELSEEHLRTIRSWNWQPDETDQYPNSPAEWMVDLLQTQMPEFNTDTLITHLGKEHDWKSFLKFPLCHYEEPEKTTFTADINGIMYNQKDLRPDASTITKDKKKRIENTNTEEKRGRSCPAGDRNSLKEEIKNYNNASKRKQRSPTHTQRKVNTRKTQGSSKSKAKQRKQASKAASAAKSSNL